MRRLTIRTKITLWYGSLLLILLTLFSFFIYFTTSQIITREEENLIKAHTSLVASEIQLSSLDISLLELYKMAALGTYITIYDLNGFTIAGDEPQIEIAKLEITYPKLRSVNIDGIIWMVYDQPVFNEKEIVAWIRGSRNLDFIEVTLLRIRLILLSIIPLYMVIAIFGGLFLADRALSPVAKIIKTAREIGKGDFSRRLKFPKTKDEVGILAMTFDEMLDRLEDSFKREKQFTSDASHELRTPIAIISSQAEDTLEGKKKVIEYREALGNILNESKKMSYIVSQLLMLSRKDSGLYIVNKEKIDLGIVIEEVVNQVRELAQNKEIKIYSSVENNLVINADQTLITQMLMNLIDNAIKYNRGKGWIRLNASTEKDNIKLVVEDNGIGIPQEDLPNIFNRFYRADKARSSEGFGLGLFIVKWIVELHRGTIKAESIPDRGSKFIIILPVKELG